MEIANIVLRLMAASQVLLFVGIILFSRNPARARIVTTVLMLGIFAYLLGPIYLVYVGPTYSILFWYLGSTVPSWLLLFVWVLFEDNEPIPKWVLALVVPEMLISLVSHLIHAGVISGPAIHVPLHYIKIIIIGIAMFVVWQGRDADLVEVRVKFRNIFVFSIMLIASTIVTVELLTGFAVPEVIEVFGMAAILLSSLIFNFYFMRVNPSAKLVYAHRIKRENGDDKMIQNLLKRMQAERLYADHDLRVASLADILGVPEYQLRKRINKKLGYRNFNQFINQYRIEEAGVRLINEIKTPVLSIALDVGFRSISSFNTAFNAQFGVSPTQYRAQFHN